MSHAGMYAQPPGMSALTWAEIHREQQALKARGPLRGRNPCTALPPIPEAPARSDKPDWESVPAPSERTDSDRSEASQATTVRHRQGSGAERTAERTTDERELPARRSVVAREWPEDREMREAHGRLTLKASEDQQAEGRGAVCRIRDGVLTLGIERRSAAGERTEEVVAEVPVEALLVGLQGGHANMFTLATVYNNTTFDEIYCFCADPVRRDRWIAVFRRMGVAISESDTRDRNAASVRRPA